MRSDDTEMDEGRFRRLEALFEAARALAPPARDAYLARECAGDAALRGEVEELLGHLEGDAGPADESFLAGGDRLRGELLDAELLTYPQEIAGFS